MKKFIITLTKSKNSTTLANKRIAQAKEMGIDDIQIFPATDKYDAWERWGNGDMFISNFSLFQRDLPSELGTFFSHYDLWKKCIELDENILILEHDVWFKANPNVEQFDSFNGDVINLGYPAWGSNKINPKKIGIPNHKYWEELPPGLRLRPIDNTEYSDQIFLFGAYSYIVTPKGAKKLINNIPDGIEPADVFIAQKRVDIYDYLPHPIIHKNEKSFIQNSIHNEWDY